MKFIITADCFNPIEMSEAQAHDWIDKDLDLVLPNGMRSVTWEYAE